MDEDRRFTDPFKDDLHKLIEHMADIRGSVSEIKVEMVNSRKIMEDHHRTLYGVNGTPGLTIVVDRLDQVEKSRTKHLSIIYTAIAGIGLKAFWGFIVGNKAP